MEQPTLEQLIEAAKARKAAAEAEEQRKRAEAERVRVQAHLNQTAEQFEHDFSEGLRRALGAVIELLPDNSRACVQFGWAGFTFRLQHFTTANTRYWHVERIIRDTPGYSNPRLQIVMTPDQQARDDALVLALAELLDEAEAQRRNAQQAETEPWAKARARQYEGQS